MFASEITEPNMNNEKEKCFAIPAHVWTAQDAIVEDQAPAGWTRRNWLYREAAVLDAEATPAPLIDPID